MTARDSLLLPVRWDGKCIIDPTLFRLDVSWLRRITLRELLAYVLKEVAPKNRVRLDDADDIMVSVNQQIDECNIGGSK